MTDHFVTRGNSHHADGWSVSTEHVDFFVTEDGAQIAPVTFRWNGKTVQPYHLTPWQDEEKSSLQGMLKNLRGEIFCMPFGGNAEAVDGEKHPAHGEIAGGKWTLRSSSSEGDCHTVEFAFSAKVRRAEVVKTITVNRNHPVLYFSHKIKNSSGGMSLGHHPILKMPDEGKQMLLSAGSFDFGMTCPGVFSDPGHEAYQILARGTEFRSLEALPSLHRDIDSLDYSIFPSPVGFTDLFCMFKKPSPKPAWVAAVYPSEGYLWFALKDASVLPSTNVWVSNSGRFFAPWNGRTRCIGIEDTCSFFASGLKPSVEHNFLNDLGFATSLSLDSDPEIRHIQGIAAIPEGFGKVADLVFGQEKISFLDVHGHRISVPVNYQYVMAEHK